MKSKYLTLILLISIFGCKNKTATEVVKKTPIVISAVKVEPQDLKEYLTFNGVTQYLKKENIRSNVTGYISWMHYKIGDAVKRGQTFAKVRTKEQDVLNEAIKIDSSLAKFSTPLAINCNSSGIISALNIQENDYVAEGDILATVSQPGSLVIQVNVPYEYEDFIKVGTPCEIKLPNGESISAKITGNLPVIDPIAQSQAFLIALPNQDLPENLNVLVKTIYKEAANSISVPHEALQTNELMTNFWVMKVLHDTLAIKVPVLPLLRTDAWVQIESNQIKLNDWIVTQGSYQMQDSTLVSIQNH
jgi:hypothetical protein